MTMPITLLRTALVGALTILPAATTTAQPRTPVARPADPAPIVVPDERNAHETRQRLREVLEQYPPSVAQVLQLDPSLLTRPDHVGTYPTLAAFLAQHPEVAHNPVFFLGGAGEQQYTDRSRAMSALESVFLGLEFMFGFIAAVAALAWMVRSALDYRRWLRAIKIQTDAHTKIVDRLASNEDLLAYMQSAVGQRFLSASPAFPALESVPPTMIAPFNRILWSVQAGVVLATAGVGLWFAKNGVIDEVAQPLHVVSILAIALGAGFVLSALASYALSRQLGLVPAQNTHA
jgi:heme/copper-type cytochrome/quinol oxidase subunit 3